MNNQEILEKLQIIFNALFLFPVQISPDTSAKDVEEWDSLMHISLVVAVESAFKVKFRAGEVEETKNIAEFIDLIAQKLN